MLESISIKNIATYDETGITLSNLRKINFIYGSNGCGKTTISNFLYAPNDEKYNCCSIKWKGDLPIKTLVYNKEFRERNFGKGSINGVFTLGEATKEDIELITKKKEELELITEEGISKKNVLTTQKEKLIEQNVSFKETVWKDIYKKYEYFFKEAFRGHLSKETFKEKILKEFIDNRSSIITIEELKEKYQIIFGQNLSQLDTIDSIDGVSITNIELDTIWKKKIIGQADVNIGALIQRLNINDWVNEGQLYIQEDSNICPFCQKETITNEFRHQIKDYFDESFQENVALIKKYGNDYSSISAIIENVLTEIENTEKEKLNSKLRLNDFSALVKALIAQMSTNREIMFNKIKEPSRRLNLTDNTQLFENINKVIDIANKEIEKHNLLVNNYQKEKEKLINEIWRYITEEYKAQIQEHLSKTNNVQKGILGLTRKIEELQVRYKTLDSEIKELSKNVTSVQPSIDEINRVLLLYGFNNFKIVPSIVDKNQYQIQREDGSLAETTLSEGEITFITFLYFLQLTKGSIDKDSISEDRILVIDDPVSSLDSNVLFIVSSLLKETIKNIKLNNGNIKQLILLTHNVYFHKEVSFIDGRTPKNGDTFYWILRKINNISTVQGFEMENPIVSSYELLWKELKNRDHNSGITIQNIMRRIIENYFRILGKYGDDVLIQKFSNPLEQEVCRSLICWINDGSHCLPDDLFIEAPADTIDKYFEVFRKIFKEMGHISHYNMMMADQSFKA